MILLLAPGPNIAFGAMPSGGTYVSDGSGLIEITSNSTADQAALQNAGCYTLTPFGGWGAGLIDTLADLYAADAASGLILPGQTGFPRYTAIGIYNDGSNGGTWAKTGTGTGAGNWTQVSTSTLVGAATAAQAAATTAVAAQVAAQAAAASIATPIQGGFEDVTVDAGQRIVRGWQHYAGPRDFPVERATRSAVLLGQIRALRHQPLPAVVTSPPVVSILAAPTLTDDIADVAYYDDARLSYAHAAPQVRTGSPANTYMIGGWISYSDATVYADTMSLRFASDAPYLELILGDLGGGSNFGIEVDGQPIARDRVVQLFNSGTTRFVGINFGADAQTIRPAVAVAAAGTGYAPGDVVTVSGGTGGALALVVTQVGTGGALANWYVRDRGGYTALPAAGAATTTTGAGSGATITLTDTLSGGNATSGHTTRRMRRIEAIGAFAKFGGVRVPKYSSIRAWPAVGPRLMVMIDSYNDTYAEYPGGSWPWLLARRLGIDDVWTNGVGGQGMVQEGSPNLNYGHRLKNVVDNQPGQDRATILVTQGSINDRNSGGTSNLQAYTQAYWERAFVAMPDAFLIQTGILIGPSDGTTDSYDPLLRAGFAAAQALHDPLGRRSAWIETQGIARLLTGSGGAAHLTGAGSADYWIAGDLAHPTQAGHDFLAAALAGDILAALHSMTL